MTSTTVPLSALLLLSAILFAIGWMGILLRRNILILFMSIEVMLGAVNFAFVSVSRYTGTIDGQLVALFVMALAACEAAVGLAILILLFRHHKTVNVDFFNGLKG